MQRRGLTSSQLRKAISERFGFAVSIPKLFSGKCQPSYYALFCMAQVLEATMEDLLETTLEAAA